MKSRLFDQPVSIFVGLGFPREVRGVTDAYQVLTEWPQSGRDASHDKALETCRAALAGAADATTVRAAFETFARIHDVLAPDALAASAHKAAEEWFGAWPALHPHMNATPLSNDWCGQGTTAPSSLPSAPPLTRLL